MSTQELDFSTLAPYQPRSFVPEGVELTDVDVVEALYGRLLDREIDSPGALEAWVIDRSELSAAVSQTRSVLYIRMTCQTDDQARGESYRAFVENVQPMVRRAADKLDRKFLSAWDRFGLDADRYEVYVRGLREDVELFREENVPLQTKESLLSQEYQTLTGAMTVEFEGAERTMPEMARYLHEPDRDLRQRAWGAAADRRLADADRLDELFTGMLALRNEIASNADCESFTEYQFRAYHRFDYVPEDCFSYHAAVEETVLPVEARFLDDRKRRIGVETLRPWDTAVDPDGRKPLRPFEDVPELIASATEIFRRVHPELGDQFAGLAEAGLLDLASRKGKAPGGYQSTLSEARRPFIFANAVGLDRDVRTLLHEGGHAFHALAAAHEPLLAYRHAPMEFCEVASMGMELLAGDHLDVFYDGEDLRRSRREHFEGVVHILSWVATIDAFQHWIYAHPDEDARARRDAWMATLDRFSTGRVDWNGLEKIRRAYWHRQLHIFQVPFYYIEYGIAQLGALQLWVRFREDPDAALADYRKALALGGSRPLEELFAAAGLRFDFSPETIGPLMEAVQAELDRMEIG